VPAGSPAVTVASLRSPAGEYPFLVEWGDPSRPGRVLLAAVPLDGSWGSNLPRLPAFVPLVHEIVYYLAGARSAEYDVEPGQPLRYRLERSDSPAGFTLQPPTGEPRPLAFDPSDPSGLPARLDRQPQGTVLRYELTRETGVYRLRKPGGTVIYYVVRTRKPDESDLTPASAEDRRRVAEIVPGLEYRDDRGGLTAAWVSEPRQQDVWWCLLLGMVALLCAEVWMTHRIARQHA
jgi:hypothetical protein